MNSIGELSGESDRPTATTPQHAIRLLVLMNKCGEPIGGADPAGAVKSIRSELRLQAMDFWMRNPDYLADELVTMVEQGQIPDTYFQTARALLDDPEPDLHWYPMPRWFHGAFEKLDDAFALLETYGLALMTRTGEPGKKSQRNQFYLTEAGATAAAEIGSDPVLNWYTRQVELVSLVAGNDVGDQLKARQYQQATYAKTELGLNIAAIAPRVRQRLDEISARDSVSSNNAEGEK
ncbi:hypothetical protein ACIGKR_32620 [Rhodococcus qingshengii]|uniref:hypothetical protein n=1 Tax=Rhodococcus qingshengii TaxID=334542 RepID=UPI0037CAEAE6